ncbi:MAG: hypothetical protein QM724_04220 [Flavobacteriales bacterium]
MSTYNAPGTGQFAQGNPGRRKGSKNHRTMQWKEFGDALLNNHAGKFSDVLDGLWASEDPADRVKAAELFLKLLEYFKPKMKREPPPFDGFNF